jgi:uncharacterized OsmC-like protein
MTAERISKAMQRVRAILARRPDAGIHIDEPATAHWDQGLRVVARHESGMQVTTDMPVELGGSGKEVTPGWLLRAGLASCLATRIAMEAAAAGIPIARLEVIATSTSDARGLLGMMDEGGNQISPAPRDVRLEVRLTAPNAHRERLQALIENSVRCSPLSAAVETAVPVALHIELDLN